MISKKFVIGVDVGGTNTDAVLMSGRSICGISKVPTTKDVTSGVTLALQDALSCAEKHLQISDISDQIKRVNIGTTHFLNAVIQRKSLAKVAVIRICSHASRALPPFVDFPPDLRDVINAGSFMIEGGFQIDGRELSQLNNDEIEQVIGEIKAKKIENIVIAGVFANGNPEHEIKVKELIKKHHPKSSVTLSHEIGPIGLLERENASILNECLKPLCSETLKGFQEALETIKLECPFYLTQNDGTVISADQSVNYPVLTFSSGATNSMRGAALLSGLKEAIIVDIGGTSTDVGMISCGFPRESQTRVKVGGVNTNFRMPDVYSIALGGGSIVTQTGEDVCVGPLSVAYQLHVKAKSFGGTTLTSTDIAVASGLADVGTTKDFVKELSSSLIKTALDNIHDKLELAIDQVKLSDNDIPIVLVGGGSILVDVQKKLLCSSNIIKPKFYEVANAIGAALGQVGGTHNQIVYLETTTKEEAIEKAEKLAKDDAIQHGAIPSSIIKVASDVIHVPYASPTTQPVQVKIKVIGDLEEYDKNEFASLDKDYIKLSFKSIKPNKVAIDSQEESNVGIQLPHTAKTVHDVIQATDDDWILNATDIDNLCIGAGILGCGGGGSPYLGKLRLKKALEDGKTIRIIHPKKLAGKTGYIASVAFMGSPIIVVEKLISGQETKTALSCVTEMINKGLCGTNSDETLTRLSSELPLKKEEDRWIYSSSSDAHPDLTNMLALMSAEIGGLNSIEPLVLAAELDLPVVDCDGMGRAFPRLLHFVPFVLGLAPYPSSVANEKGDVVGTAKIESVQHLELFFRDKVIEWGQAAGVCTGVMTPEEMLSKSCMNTLSRAWHIGNAVTKAVLNHQCPVQAILNECGGVLLISGKVIGLEKRTEGGFTSTDVIVEGTGSFLNKKICFVSQNEYLAAWKGTNIGSGEVLATVPDLITVVNTETGDVIPAEETRYGLRVSVLVLPAMPIMQSKEALETFGPKAFGIENVDYNPISTYNDLPAKCKS